MFRVELAPFAAVIAYLFSVYLIDGLIGAYGDLKAAVYPSAPGTDLPCRFISNHDVPAFCRETTPFPKVQMPGEE